MFTQVRSANRRVSPVEDNKHKVVIKAVYVVLEPQYQNSLTEAAKSINEMNGPIGIDLSGYLIEELRNENNFDYFEVREEGRRLHKGGYYHPTDGNRHIFPIIKDNLSDGDVVIRIDSDAFLIDDITDEFIDKINDKKFISIYEPEHEWDLNYKAPHPAFYAFRGEYLNQGLDKAILKPVAKGYRSLPAPIKKGTGNVLNNLSTLITIPNNVLQGDIKLAAINTGRLVVNTTLGILGIFDPASEMGFPKYVKEDYGQTLGAWGVGPGCYLVLPVLGPS